MIRFAFRLVTVAAVMASVLAAQEPVSVEVHLDRTMGPVQPLYNWFGYDEANYTTAPNGQRLLQELKQLGPVPVYVRSHHLLTSGDGVAELKWSSTNVYREDQSGNPIYDFRLFDGIFDAYLAAGVRPMVELGFMPKDLAAELPGSRQGAEKQPYQVHFPGSTVSGASNNPPRDFTRWYELVRRVTEHLVERYGRERVAEWYFEVWNEPDIDYWHGTPAEYWKLYDYSVAAVRSVLPNARVGGPASTGPGSGRAYAFLEGFLNHIERDRSASDGKVIPLDFISFHAKGKPTIVGTQVTMGLRNELVDVDRGFEIIASHQRFRDIPIILSEADPEGCAACSSKLNPANNYRNGTLYPAYTAAAYKALLDLQVRRGVNLLGMLSWAFEFEGKDTFEGFRSLATNGVDKPILNFFRMVAQLRGQRLEAVSTGSVGLDAMLEEGVRGRGDIDALASAESSHTNVLLWNYRDEAAPDSLDTDRDVTSVDLKLSGIPAGVGHLRVREYRIDQGHSNAYTVWKAMGSPAQLTGRQWHKLKKRDGLEAVGGWRRIAVRGRTGRLFIALPRQSVSLLRVEY